MALVYSGGTYISSTFTGDTKWSVMKNLRDQLVNAGWTNKAYGTTAALGTAATATITIASPGVVTMTGHGFTGGERVTIATTGALPTNLSVNTVYFIKFIDANTFNLATTSGGANINTSGSQSGTHTLYTESMLLESATQSGVTNPTRVRIKDNLGTCAAVSLENQAGTLASTSTTAAGGHLLPAASQTMRVIATKYWFTCFVPGSAGARTFVYAGMPYVDSSILTSVTDVGFMFANSVAEGTSSALSSFRAAPVLTGLSNSSPNYAVIYNSSLVQGNNASTNGSPATAGAPECVLSCQSGGLTATARSYRWANDDLLTSDVLVGWGSTSTADEAKIRGQFYDMIYIADAIAMDTSTTFSGHSWFNLTNNFTQTSAAPRGGMWVRTDT